MDIEKFLDGQIKPKNNDSIYGNDLNKVYWFIVDNKKERKRLEEYWRSSVHAVKNKADELSKIQNQLIKSEKMAVLGRSFAGVSHELNTPIGAAYSDSHYLVEISKNLEKKLKNSCVDNTSIFKNIKNIIETSEDIIENIKRAGDIVNNIKLISVDQNSERKREFNVLTYLNKTVHSLKSEVEAVVIDIKGDENISILSYPGPLSQIVTNLIVNASRHAFPNKRIDAKIEIVFKLEENTLALSFLDNGEGISNENLGKIFDPFFTTKMGTGGSGIGLTLVQNIVEKIFKGEIRCVSEIGKGSKFDILLKI